MRPTRAVARWGVGSVHHLAWRVDDERAPARRARAGGNRRPSGRRRSSIASGSSRSTSRSPAACSSSSRPTAPASPSTRIASIWARRSCCRRGSSPRAAGSKPALPPLTPAALSAASLFFASRSNSDFTSSSARLRIARSRADATSTKTVGDATVPVIRAGSDNAIALAREAVQVAAGLRAQLARQHHVGRAGRRPATPATACPSPSCRDRATRSVRSLVDRVWPATASDAARRVKASPEPARDARPTACRTRARRSARGRGPELRPSVITTRAVPRARRIASTGSTPAAASATDAGEPAGHRSRRTRQTRRAPARRDSRTCRATRSAARAATRRIRRIPRSGHRTASIFRPSSATARLRHPGRRLEIGERDAERAPLARADRDVELQRDDRGRRRAGASGDALSRGAGRRRGGEKGHQPIEVERLRLDGEGPRASGHARRALRRSTRSEPSDRPWMPADEEAIAAGQRRIEIDEQRDASRRPA